MEISTFELLVKRIAPVPPAPVDVARRVVQGYFLTITNLESRDLTFRIRFNISRPNPVDSDRTLFNNVDLLFDIAGANNVIPLSGNVNSTVFAGSFLLPARQTASVQLLPKIGLFSAANPDFEVRGFVTLTLPRIQGQAQSVTPVRVLLNPEIRGTFLPNNFPGGTGGDFDQINYPLVVATGKALNEIPSDFPILIPPIIPPEILQPLAPETAIALEDLDDLEKVRGLIELMAQIDKDSNNLQHLSDALSKLNIPIRVSAN
ncbi:MAG: hypothetical protein HC903_30270 [Methylacidiphilales bacterium]|nr:hypothetical protein [Candidatus Methylacidiphilales bacterium]NJR19897.1 hypothetical protein [Calothrix sp. CSU_2_0]